jgi:quinol monooxygenase YgiN
MKSKASASEVHLTATFYPRTGQSNAVEAALKVAVQDVNQEKGCIRYELTESQPELLVLTEVWASQADLDRHNVGLPLKRLNEELDGKLAHPVHLDFA